MLKDTIPSIPALAALRNAVLHRSVHRTPKWGFRLAEDLVVELQPKQVSASPAPVQQGFREPIMRFEGIAVLAEGATAAMLKKAPRGVVFWSRKFSLTEFADDPHYWYVNFGGGRKRRGIDPNGWTLLNERILAALQPGGVFTQMTPALMLKPACMLCGHPLTDPASMARWIGPECAGTSSVRVFWAHEVSTQG